MTVIVHHDNAVIAHQDDKDTEYHDTKSIIYQSNVKVKNIALQ